MDAKKLRNVNRANTRYEPFWYTQMFQALRLRALQIFTLCLLSCVVLFIASLPTNVLARPGYISTIAGGGLGDGGLATNAKLGRGDRMQIALDSTGNIYFADSGTHSVRKITAATDVITTIAGTGKAGVLGFNGEATKEQLSRPSGIALDGAGNVYIADTDNNRVRKVVAATGMITTIAGNGVSAFGGDNGPAINAQFKNPTTLSVDGAGDIYINDAGNYRIRKITASTGAITTVAGTGSPGFSGDGGPATSANLDGGLGAVDSAGSIYIVGADRIRKVTAATGIITTVAGTGVRGFSGDGGPAINAQLDSPTGVALDSGGNLYIADAGNYRTRKVAVGTGVITSIPAADKSSLEKSGSTHDAKIVIIPVPSFITLALDSAGNIYTTDSVKNPSTGVFLSRVQKLTAATGIRETIAGLGDARSDNILGVNSDLDNPYSVVANDGGDLYIGGGDGIRKLTVATGVMTTILRTSSPNYVSARGLAVNAAGIIYIADGFSNQISKLNVATGQLTKIAGTGAYGYSGDNGPALTAEFRSPTDLAIDSLGNIYVVDSNNNCVRKITAATGVITTIVNNVIPTGVAVDATNNVYVTDAGNRVVLKWIATTGNLSVVAGGGSLVGDNVPAISVNLNYPSGVRIDRAGDVYIVDPSGGSIGSDALSRILRVNVVTGLISTVAGASPINRDDGPAPSVALGAASIAPDSSGNLYILDRYQTGFIRKLIAPVGEFATVDLSADGKSDLLFRNSNSGEIVGFFMNGGAVENAAGLLGPGSWTVIHTADLDSDGRADLVLRNTTDGSTVVFLMNGFFVKRYAMLLGATAWTVTHVADVDGDGQPDFILRNTDGSIYVWKLYLGVQVVEGALLRGADSGWTVTHTADFNGDGKADVLLRHDDGRIAMWTMNGITIVSDTQLLPAGSGWTVVGTGDFNGDGKADMLQRHTDGSLAVSIMDGPIVTASASLLGPGAWSVSKVADFDGDGKSDILLRNADGTLVIFTMNGTAVKAGGVILNATSVWSPVQTGDYNGDGKADAVLRHTDGTTVVFLINGTTVASGSAVTGAGPWSVVPGQ
jgi:trimeric autotransporter adhesin